MPSRSIAYTSAWRTSLLLNLVPSNIGAIRKMPAAGLLATLMPATLLSVSVSVTEIWVCRISPFCSWAVATSEVAMWTKMRSSLAGGPQ